MSRLGHWCFLHRKVVLLVWLVALVGSFLLVRATGTDYSTKFTLPNVDSARALTLLQDDFPAASGGSDQVVIHAREGSVTDPDVKPEVERMLSTVERIPHVTAVTSPYSPEGASQISKDGSTAFATVVWDTQPQSLPPADVKELISVARSIDSDTVEIALSGQDIENDERANSSVSTLGGIILALIVLVIAFGALFAALMPMATALPAIGIGYCMTGLFSHIFPVANFANILGVLIGLGVGVDYALFILTRQRAAIKAGASIEDAVSQAVDTAGRAVFFAGITVCVALLGQFALGLSFLYGIAISSAVTVALTMLSALTLLPAWLGFVGMKVLSRKQRRELAAEGPHDEIVAGPWYRWARFIERHPIWPAVIAGTAVVLIALPVLTLRLGLDDAGTDPSGTTTLRAYHLLSDGFGPGFSGPLQMVGKLDSPGDVKAFGEIINKVGQEPGVASTGPVVQSPNGKVAIANVFPATTPQSVQTTDLLNNLRSTVLPALEKGTGATVLVGGTTAIQVDFAHILAGKLLFFIAVIVLFGFLLLMAVFRSLLVPAIASVMNILSVGAALGIMNVVFEWGWGHSLFRLSGDSPVAVFVPVLMISILFGLSMDYEVFLVSRIHEEWVLRRDNREAVTIGQAATGRVITAAAMIMILVFASFALGENILIKQFGIGLAGAIIVDAFIVRTVLVPALMHICGKANWWLPGWLDRFLPELNVEGNSHLAVPGAVPQGVVEVP